VTQKWVTNTFLVGRVQIFKYITFFCFSREQKIKKKKKIGH